ncbi:hypothetical protein JCM3775_006378 [Rhodotorula graminis]
MLRTAPTLRPLLKSAAVASTSRAIAADPRRSFTSRPQASWDDEADARRPTMRVKDGRIVPHYARGDRDHPSSSSSSWSAPRRESGDPARAKPRRPKQQKDIVHPPPSPEDLERYHKTRVLRAERLERKDLTAQLTETKTYMGGFTQPRHLQFLTTLDPTRKPKDSRDVRVGPNRIRPAAEAYEPHVVYLAVTRYPVRWGHGRQTRRECFSGYCRESELVDRFRALNYGTWKEEKTELVKLRHGQPRQPVVTPAHWACLADSKEYLDQAVLPGSPEERSLLNRPASKLLHALLKERARTLRAADLEADAPSSSVPADAVSAQGRTLAELDALIASTSARLLPPVTDYTRPGPPYTSPPLVVPLLTVTLPTRPLAATLARLSNGHARGLSFIASIPNEDRKDGPALFRRLLRMRANRIQSVTRELILKLDGYGGGLMGLRMGPEDRGRGIEGEGLGESTTAPERGWAEVSWLDEASACWEGIARDEYLASWDDVEGAKAGPRRLDNARWATPHPLVPAAVGEDARASSASAGDVLARINTGVAARQVEVDEEAELGVVEGEGPAEKVEPVAAVESSEVQQATSV